MNIVLKKRELELLGGLYQLRMLSAGQIRRAYYDGINYAYKKIKALEKAGYVESRPLIEGPSKKTQYYYLTQKGVDELKLQNARRADKNVFTEKFMVERQLIVNEIPVTILQLERQNGTDIWQWQDSREAKRAYGFNMRDLIAGVLVNRKSGEKYGVYVPTVVMENRLDDEITRYVTGLVTQIQDEIDRHSYLRDNLVICHTTELLKEFRKRMKPVGTSLKILVMNYGINYIYNIMSDYTNVLKRLYSKLLNKSEDTVIKSPEFFATHYTSDYFITEFLTYDIVMMRAAYEYVSKAKAAKPIIAFCWDRQKKQVERDFRMLLSSGLLQIHTVLWDESEFKDGVKVHPYGRRSRDSPPKVRMRFSLAPAAAGYLQSMGNEKRSMLIEQLVIRELRKFSAGIDIGESGGANGKENT